MAFIINKDFITKENSEHDLVHRKNLFPHCCWLTKDTWFEKIQNTIKKLLNNKHSENKIRHFAYEK